jgi:prepilin-type N-terminal cleavage/methylation domain-containing protein
MRDQKGFTLIELLLVIALLAISVGVSTDIIINLTRSYSKTQVTHEIEQSANFVLLKLEKELRNADSVSLPSAASPTGNVLNFTDKSGDTVCYRIHDNKVQRYYGTNASCPSGSYVDLTSNAQPLGVYVSSAGGNAFTLISSNPYVVQLDLRFQQSGSEGGTSFTGIVDLNNTIVVRGSY